jgi:MFS family permease
MRDANVALSAASDPRSDRAASKGEARRTLAITCGAHVLHDGYADLIWVALPIWQAEFGLSYAAVGFLRSIFSGTMAAFQIPAAAAAHRLGNALVLAAGTALAGLCYGLAGLSAGFGLLLAALVLGGFGTSTQHPLASAMVANAFAGARSLPALGTYNFAGDVGKVMLPAAATALLFVMPWRPAYGLLGLVGIAAGIAIFALTPRAVDRAADDHRTQAEPPVAPSGGVKPRHFKPGYFILLAIAAIDNVTRGGFLVFLPFLLIGKGASVTTAGFALTLVFVGGAAGKLGYAWLAARFGAVGTICISKGLTACGMLGLLILPLAAALPVLPLFGLVLNGSSSVTYGSVPQFAEPAERNRAFSWFYTGTLAPGALAPTLSGSIGDLAGVPVAVAMIAALVLVTLPLAWRLRSALQTECVA